MAKNDGSLIGGDIKRFKFDNGCEYELLCIQKNEVAPSSKDCEVWILVDLRKGIVWMDEIIISDVSNKGLMDYLNQTRRASSEVKEIEFVRNVSEIY